MVQGIDGIFPKYRFMFTARHHCSETTASWVSVIWACHNVKDPKVCRAMEFPFANANGAVVTPEKCRAFGRDIALALRTLLDGR